MILLEELLEALHLTEQDIYNYFGGTYASRGDSYQRSGRVSNLTVSDNEVAVLGEVQGSDTQPYFVSIILKTDGIKIANCQCSCPMGGFCKHSAALLLHAIRTRLPLGFRIDGSVRDPSTEVVDESTGSVFFPLSISSQSSSKSKLSRKFTDWVDDLASALGTLPDSSQVFKSASQSGSEKSQLNSVLYHLNIASDRQLCLVTSYAKKLKTGAWGRAQEVGIERIAARATGYVTVEDFEFAKLFLSASGSSGGYGRYAPYGNTFTEIVEISAILIERVLNTGRCFWQDGDAPLSLGPSKKGVFKWETTVEGKQILCCKTDKIDDIAAIAGTAWYIDPIANQLGALDLPLPLVAIKTIFAAPAIDVEEVGAASLALAKFGEIIPLPSARYNTETIALKPKPCLLLWIYPRPHGYYGGNSKAEQPQAILHFNYGDYSFNSLYGTESRIVEGDKVCIRKKDRRDEDQYIKQLVEFGLIRSRDIDLETNDITFTFAVGAEESWFGFTTGALPILKEQGWQIKIDKSFEFDVVIPEEDWIANATHGSNFWFSLELGITIDGEIVPLLPILHEALKRIVGVNPFIEIEQLNRNGIFYAPLKDGRQAALPFERVKDIVGVLLELFDKTPNLFGNGAEVSLPQILNLSKIFSNKYGSSQGWKIGKKLEELMEKVIAFNDIKAAVLPKTFKAELRPYQLEGLGWLNFLRTFELGGILADDMGLGKTVQTLAHITLEKHEKRLNKPFLVICPTSVLPNWLSEIEKFAPKLKVTALFGPDRSSNFSKIAASDIVITTYPLVMRDESTLWKQGWKAVVLDEAQAIKNPTTLVAQAIIGLTSDYRICLTGTPIENHLGELWSQFNFLMPGFLKDLTTFTRKFRTPIEKHHNKVLQKVLAAKVQPFLLRRTKDLVAKDLPAKTVMIKRVELAGAQRDLYETVRVAMSEKVREAVASRGLAKSQIIILEAMLKLRQVCGDPRLVSLAGAKKVDSSAKLEFLLEMLEELVAEGKKILLFSQFTSMLDLIIPELNKRQIKFVQIRGDTKDRAAPVQQFQNGNVPLFLLSLKAGGTGLNLTAADTVIHYDPWWNPAVENQATDRAHRIGQQKAIFVFKLIAAGTIEERMLELQDRKRGIAEAMYDDENAVVTKLTAADLESFFKPLTNLSVLSRQAK